MFKYLQVLKFLYVITPNEKLKQLASSRLGSSHRATEYLSESVVYERTENEMMHISTPDQKAQVKLLFLTDVKRMFNSELLIEDSTPLYTSEQFEQVFGADFEVSQATFDRYWTIERTGQYVDYEEEIHYLTIDRVDEFVINDMPVLEKWKQALKEMIEAEEENWRPDKR